jgi:hypothetical protein
LVIIEPMTLHRNINDIATNMRLPKSNSKLSISRVLPRRAAINAIRPSRWPSAGSARSSARRITV